MKSDFLTCFSLRSHNQCPYDKMEVTTGFISSNRFRNHLDGLSNGRLNWLYGGKKRPHHKVTPHDDQDGDSCG